MWHQAQWAHRSTAALVRPGNVATKTGAAVRAPSRRFGAAPQRDVGQEPDPVSRSTPEPHENGEPACSIRPPT
jgi:hypothetical protein